MKKCEQIGNVDGNLSDSCHCIQTTQLKSNQLNQLSGQCARSFVQSSNYLTRHPHYFESERAIWLSPIGVRTHSSKHVRISCPAHTDALPCLDLWGEVITPFRLIIKTKLSGWTPHVPVAAHSRNTIECVLRLHFVIKHEPLWNRSGSWSAFPIIYNAVLTGAHAWHGP